jgi:hypothetical protein
MFSPHVNLSFVLMYGALLECVSDSLRSRPSSPFRMVQSVCLVKIAYIASVTLELLLLLL